MRTNINWKAFANKPKDTVLKMLASAVQFEVDKVHFALDMVSRHKSLPVANVKRLAGTGHTNPDYTAMAKSWLGQKYATPSDTPELVDPANQYADFIHTNMPELDMGFTALFQLVDMRATFHDHFDIVDTNAGVTFDQRQPGAITRVRRNISEALTTVKYMEFSDGLGILDSWIDFQQWWKIDDAIGEFVAKYYEKMAGDHYTLFTALGAGVDVAFDTDDTTTINKAMGVMLRNLRGKGYGVGQNSGFVILTNPEKVGRIEKMLTATRGSAIVDQQANKEPVAVHVQSVVTSTDVPAAETGYYLVLPGHKIKRGLWKDLTIESDRNIYASAEDLVAVGRYNAAIGDSAQVARVKFA